MSKILTCVFLVIFLSCGKDGSIGPKGEQGIQGIRGEKGEDGSTIYNGTVVPPASLGHEGDFYFRSGTSDFYGPKTASGWGTPTNLKGATGATGATGAAGSKILSGTAVPPTSIGANGDFYFRTTTADFYGPKATSGWGTPINFKGVKGDDGSRIYSGASVPATSLGNSGDFYFRTSTSDFYGPKTASSWGTPTNLKGATGATGSTGAAGSKILSGTAVPTASIGVNGDFYLRTTTADFYGPKTSSGWGTAINLRGAQGPSGPQGPRGTANVIYSDWFILDQLNDWVFINTKHVNTLFYINALAAYPNSLVMVYVRTVGSSQIRALPVYNFDTGYTILSYEFSYHYELPVMTIDVKSSTANIGQNMLYDSFRYVIIPGGVATTAMSSQRNTERSVEIKGKIYSKSVLEKMSYNEVSKLVGIPE
ncbi:hypothetical protein FAZ19_15320 [Sphingobacterium alkalisoli]|uniref:Collagen-like protein n=1 Tax=Sphingobacterium alkalisoli TaxID=1874115 RepID=A0A4U0GZA0_9SPHI|nr:hypothetical protein [Sphingobacterium alkalisoli]TJY64561.1 hypothetical protein FAZ19_15320 [Sphingobacterium alkalisoli]GGH20973.1 hypothetical protein GCM10011418_26550 [Sphingobacterium alkalisoli]